MSLTAKTCTPCQGGIDPMSKERAEAMMSEVPGWKLADSAKRIVRNFETKDFAESLAFDCSIDGDDGQRVRMRLSLGCFQPGPPVARIPLRYE